MRQAQPIAQQPARQPFADATKNQNKITTDLPSLGGDNIIKKPHMEYETYKVGCKILLCISGIGTLLYETYIPRYVWWP